MIAGRNGAGKSSIVRALASVLLNTPSSTKMIRRGASRFRVILKAGPHTFERIRGNSKNIYKVNGGVLAVPKTSVPVPVLELTSVIPENFQRQADGLFLLSESPGVLAKRLNSLAGVEELDNASKRVKQDIRNAQGRLKEVNEQIARAKENVASSEWVMRASVYADEIQVMEAKLLKLDTSVLEAVVNRVLGLQRVPAFPENIGDMIRWVEVELLQLRDESKAISKVDIACQRVLESQQNLNRATERLEAARTLYRQLKKCPICQADLLQRL